MSSPESAPATVADTLAFQADTPNLDAEPFNMSFAEVKLLSDFLDTGIAIVVAAGFGAAFLIDKIRQALPAS